ncbi:uncharacterized protein LOC124151429 [Haliotis rufescens]|uniref:uncharacterized protein LOC124151429 n=1 Tax=Haliotis rufescens TaxID=6454 RepID=UPI00201E8921|nr:uncharacterized protein LOC124151429 [Haliotis rufescens]
MLSTRCCSTACLSIVKEKPISNKRKTFMCSNIFRTTLCRHWMIFTLMAGVALCAYMYVMLPRTEGISKQTAARSRPNTPYQQFSYKKQEERGTIEDKYVIYTCNISHCGGYADRQKGMVTAYVLSEMLGRKFGISMIRPCDFSEFIVPRDVNWTIDMNLFEGKRKDWFVNYKLSTGVLFERTDLEAIFQKDVLMYTGNIDYVYSLMKNPLFERVLWAKKLSHLDIYKYALEKLFKLSPKSQNALNGILGSIGPNYHKLVCAHIRMGKSLTIPRDRIMANRPNQTALVRFFKKRLHLGRDKLFIATDSDDVRELFRKSFPDSYLEVKGDVLHIDKPPVEYECSSMEKVILDQYILSMCDTLVMSISGFSRLAAIMRGTDHDLYLAHGNNISLSHRIIPSPPKCFPYLSHTQPCRNSITG